MVPEYPCSHTSDSPGTMSAWWEFTFNFKVVVESIKIFNRRDCCSERLSNADIKIYDEKRLNYQQCTNVGNMAYVWEKNFNCTKPLIGKGVRLQHKNVMGIITLCEVDIYGKIFK